LTIFVVKYKKYVSKILFSEKIGFLNLLNHKNCQRPVIFKNLTSKKSQISNRSYLCLMKKIINGHRHFQYNSPTLPIASVEQRSLDFYQHLDSRRSVREFADTPIPQHIIENLLLTASTAPSGAHKQPWTFCAINNAAIKSAIREAAEKEEYESYTHRMSEQWLKDLAPIGTDWRKPFLETAPWIIVVFAQSTGKNKEKHYYVQESVGIACGFLIAAIHNAGLVTLTHTPSPMNFLKTILQRPDNERPFLLLPVGYAAAEAFVPDIKRKEMKDVVVFY
jgi:iodotyrosine deiodinase